MNEKIENNNRPRREAIATRAYLLWEQTGRAGGRDDEFWLKAEAELSVKPSPVVEQAAAKAVALPSPAKALAPVRAAKRPAKRAAQNALAPSAQPAERVSRVWAA